MTHDTKIVRSRNLLLLALLIVVTLFSAYHEGYLPLISVPFWGSLIAGFAIAGWVALGISTKRFLSLVLGIFIIEYIKETIGMKSSIWSYHGTAGHYSFVVWVWVLAGLVAYTLSTKLVIRVIRKLRWPAPRWVNPVILIIISSVIPLSMGDYRSGAGGLFWLFYAVVFVVCIAVSIKTEFPVLAGIVITAWIIANPSEYVGSVTCHAWTFTHNHDYPPFFLLFGCWPLEIFVQYSVSAFLAHEPINKNTF
ncbi:MAG TPA: hypothetical protein VMW89_07680 [Desulfatiglandales bacterium]|nr:hypothetical protein [Desulfatiglandales bacterium]